MMNVFRLLADVSVPVPGAAVVRIDVQVVAERADPPRTAVKRRFRR